MVVQFHGCVGMHEKFGDGCCVCVCVNCAGIDAAKKKNILSLTWCWGSGLFVAWHVQDRGTTVLFGQDVAHLSGVKRKGGAMALERVHRFTQCGK